ncbi:AAA-domain-containing protein [Xylaria nigripes]|nr:AAA-domain-containing protein [Xylaria nigripes]
MSNQWLRAFRFVAQNPRQSGLVSRPTTTRLFHATGPIRAPDDSGNEPRDDGRKPENEASKGVTQASPENLTGENITATNGESQGRKRPANSIRSRALRTRKSDLPPVQIPESFASFAIDRHSDLNTGLRVEPAEQDRDHTSQGISTDDMLKSLSFQSRNEAFLNATAWTESDIAEVLQTLTSKGDTSPVLKRCDMFSISAYWAVLHQIRRHLGDDAYSKTLKSMPQPKSPSWVTDLLKYFAAPHAPSLFRQEFFEVLLDHATREREIPLTKAALFEPCIVDELFTAISAEFFIRAPENCKLANLRRPVTVINVQDCSGFSTAREILQHVAQKLGADILHLRSYDIAHIVGRYISQDIIRSPGDISMLGFKAAENCGRLRPPIAEEQNEDAYSLELPFAVMLREEKARKDTKRQTVSMDEYLLSSATRGKSDELWEELKVNAALDELINSSNTDVAEQKPLIIHLNDFTALNMDETGATILGKIRKNVDEMWLTGRKVVLIGSSSTNNAPKAYQMALGTLESTERIIQLSKRHFRDVPARVLCNSTLALWERQDYLRENEENITRMLLSMTDSGGYVTTHSETTLGLIHHAESEAVPSKLNRNFAKFWSSVLPMAEVYRIATIMIGLSSTSGIELFSRECFEKAVQKTSVVDAAMEKASARLHTPTSSKETLRDNFVGTRRMDPFNVNHEERLLSGLIHAQDIRTTFKDIRAPQETMESIKMLTTLSLVRPEAFSYGVLANERIPGCLLYGPPGTGKTLLAKAVAKESGANMIEVSGASINNMYVGESEKNVRALFQLAKKKEPMVIFIDEADALLGARGGHLNGSRRDTINQFLREWDGMDKTKAFIMVATNRPFDLDEAVLRRLPRKLLIDLPLEADRAAILRIHLKDEIIDRAVSIEDIAKRTPLYSGSDLKNVSVAAAMAAVKEELEASELHTGPGPYKWAEKRILSQRHFDKALKEIGASVSEDMATLTAIKKFDERYGDGKARKKRKGMGFEVVPEASDSDQARVRSGR